MPDAAQAALITEIGEMIVEDPEVNSAPWQAVAFVATVEGGREEMTGYRYDADGTFEAADLNRFGDVMDRLVELRGLMQAEAGGNPWAQCLIQIRKPDYALKMVYEYENSERWAPGAISLDMTDFAESIRPG